MTNRILLAIFCVWTARANERTVTAHIFIHDTKSTTPTSNNRLLRITRSMGGLRPVTNTPPRIDTHLFDQNFMLEDGLVYVSDAALHNCRIGALPPQLSRRAATHIISAYDTLNHVTNSINRYYTFGWTGVADTSQARTLYEQLTTERDRLHKWYPKNTVQFIIHAHGNGGTITFLLAEQENELRKNLELDYVILYGTPIQLEIVHACEHPMFKAILNLFSMGDHWQTNHGGISAQNYRTFGELHAWINTPNKYIIDVTININDNAHAFNHAALFCLDDASYQARIFELIRPLPIVTFAPALLALIQRLPNKPSRARLNIITNSRCYLELTAPKVRGRFLSPDLAPHLVLAKQVIEQTWRPFAINNGTIRSSVRAIKNTLLETPQALFKDYIKPWFD